VAISLIVGARGMRQLSLAAGAPGLTLHWGFERPEKAGWALPPAESWPPGSKNHKDRAVQSPFPTNGPLRIPLERDVLALNFVLKDAAGNWLNPPAGSGDAFRFDCRALALAPDAAAGLAAATPQLAAAAGAAAAGVAPPEPRAPQPPVAPPPPPPVVAAAPVAPPPPSVAAPAAPEPAPPSPADATRAAAYALRSVADARVGADGVVFEREWAVGAGGACLARVVSGPGEDARLCIVARCPPAVPLRSVHWAALASAGAPWGAPPAGWSTTPPQSADAGGGAWDTLLEHVGGDLCAATVQLSSTATGGVAFVLRSHAGDWLKDGKSDLYAPLSAMAVSAPPYQQPRNDKPPPKEQQQQQQQQYSPPPPASNGKAPARITRKGWSDDELRTDAGGLGIGGAAAGYKTWAIEACASSEDGCQKSLMHRFNTAHELLKRCEADGEPAVVVLFTWLRFMATRQLVWNRNYNVKPREISAAQNGLTATLCRLHRERADLRDVVRLTMCCVGRGGTGDMGQRIRDEILDIQRRNHAMGGFMEEWHQKLHNNTTPDDVVICEGLLAYLAAGLDVKAYWARLDADGITKERLLSFERAIRAEPRFERDQIGGLTKDLTEYLRTLKAVHSGADLTSAADAVLGYKQASSQGVSIDNPPVGEVATPRLRELLAAAQGGAAAAAGATRRGESGDKVADALLCALEAMVEARRELRPWTQAGGKGVANGRDRDVLYLDLALEAAVRTAVESALGGLGSAPAPAVLKAATLATESLALSAGSNAELVLCLKEMRAAVALAEQNPGDAAWALRAKAVADRLRLSLAGTGERATAALQAPAMDLGGRLKVDGGELAIFSEEVVRSGAAAPLSQLLRALEPRLRAVAHLGAWQVISPHAAAGTVVCVPRLADVQNTVYAQPTVIVASHVSGEEDIAAGAVAVLTPDAPDVLSHVSVRARNEKVLFATVFDAKVFESLKSLEGAFVECKPSPDGADVAITRADPVAAGAPAAAAAPAHAGGAAPRIVPRPFQGTFALASDAFTAEVVGGKSRNLNGLRGAALPEGVKLPASAALTFGAFDACLADPINAPTKLQIDALVAELASAPESEPVREATLATLRAAVRRLAAPLPLVSSLRDAMRASGIPFPGDPDGPGSWDEAWAAVTGVWASKWNVRAATACRKAHLRHEDLAMAVLVQAVVQPRYAFVLHTVHPVSGDAGEVYGELVCGLGETLVGAYPGRALSFSARKAAGTAELVGPATLLGYPSKAEGLFLPMQTLIFRSDSNGEDLEGFAGAGLYDSIPMHKPQAQGIDYAGEQLLSDAPFRETLLRRIAAAGAAVENALGSPQDIEGVVTPEGDIYLVQTRPQV
jgi:alpha-glucan,water dikinase